MSTVWREVDAELRGSRAQTLFCAPASGVRDWLSEGHGRSELLAAIDVLPDAPHVRPLLDPLQDTVLARLTGAAAGSTHESLAAEPHADGASQTQHAARHLSAGKRFAGDLGCETPASAMRMTASAPAVSAQMPARVAALLARHARLRSTIEGAVKRAPWTEPAAERRIVPFASHHGGEPLSRAPAALSSPPAMLARWSAIAALDPVRRLEAATGRALAPSERTSSDVSSARRDAASLHLHGVPASLGRSIMPAQSAPPSPVLRLADLAASGPPQDTQGAHGQSPVHAAAEVHDAPSAANGESALVRMAGALARIEERLAAPAPSAEPPMQWLTEDDTLAERIHDILRRQALRHGIDPL